MDRVVATTSPYPRCMYFATFAQNLAPSGRALHRGSGSLAPLSRRRGFAGKHTNECKLLHDVLSIEWVNARPRRSNFEGARARSSKSTKTRTDAPPRCVRGPASGRPGRARNLRRARGRCASFDVPCSGGTRCGDAVTSCPSRPSLCTGCEGGTTGGAYQAI
eukprot:COSAG03_NODE_905_length_5401_cov_2.949830_2_plen_162_part_00